MRGEKMGAAKLRGEEVGAVEMCAAEKREEEVSAVEMHVAEECGFS